MQPLCKHYNLASYDYAVEGNREIAVLGEIESHYLGFGAPVSFAPYLDDLNHRLTRQYLLTFLAKPERKAGFQQFKLRTEVPNAELVAADRVYVRAGM